MEEQIPTTEAPVTTEPAPEAAPVETPTPVEAPVAETLVRSKTIDEMDAKELKAHPKFAGVLGSELQQARPKWEQETRQKLEQEQQAKWAREQREADEAVLDEELERTAEYSQNPRLIAAVERRKRERAERDADTKAMNAVISANIQTAEEIYKQPEWQAIPEERRQAWWKGLEAEVTAMPAERHAAFLLVHANRLLGEVRQANWEANERAKIAAKEREAATQEITAKLFKASDAPDTARSKGVPAPVDINSMTWEQFEEYKRQRHPNLWNTKTRS